MKEVGNTMRMPTLAAVLMISFLIFSCSSIPTEDTINGGFEKESDNEPEGWISNLLPQISDYVKFTVDDNTFHSGGSSFLIELSKSQPEKQTIYKLTRRLPGFETSVVYELQGWIKTENIKNSPFLEAQCWSQTTMLGYASSKKIMNITGTTDWKFVNAVFRVPKETVKILIVLGVPSTKNNNVKVWFDDIQVKKVR